MEEPVCIIKESQDAYKSLDVCNYVLCAGRDVFLMKYWTISTHYFPTHIQFTKQKMSLYMSLSFEKKKGGGGLGGYYK